MRRWCAGVEYHGGAYSGWQAQNHHVSVQATLETALSRIANHPVRLIAAGRTDAGVHALQQVVHFDSDAARQPDAWVLGSNTQLPADISLPWVKLVDENFNARYSALSRRYRYLIHNHRSRSALSGGRATWWTYPLDAACMHLAAQALVGTHDFSAFRASVCQSRTPVRNLLAIDVFRRGDFVVIDVIANAFLHHMVRNISGSLLMVGQGRHPETWIAELLAGRDRTRAGMTAPAAGLYFVGPRYPDGYGLPPPPEPWFPAG